MSNPKFVLITGASSGIGECFARALAARHHSLVLLARSKAKLEALAKEFSAAYDIRTEVLDTDLVVPGAPSEVEKRLRERGLSIDILINNAGVGGRGRFWELPAERQIRMMQLNMNALVELTYLLLPSMLEQRRGALINVSSTASFQPIPYTAVYAATKAFVTSFSMAIAEELRPYGIKVVTLCPGGTATNFFVAGNYGKRKIPGGLQPTTEVVDAALRALDGNAGMVVPRLMNKLGVFVQRFVPREVVTRAAAKIFRV